MWFVETQLYVFVNNVCVQTRSKQYLSFDTLVLSPLKALQVFEQKLAYNKRYAFRPMKCAHDDSPAHVSNDHSLTCIANELDSNQRERYTSWYVHLEKGHLGVHLEKGHLGVHLRACETRANCAVRHSVKFFSGRPESATFFFCCPDFLGAHSPALPSSRYYLRVNNTVGRLAGEWYTR